MRGAGAQRDQQQSSCQFHEWDSMEYAVQSLFLLATMCYQMQTSGLFSFDKQGIIHRIRHSAVGVSWIRRGVGRCSVHVEV